MKQPTGCFATKNSIAIGPNLDIRPCCRFSHSENFGFLYDYDSITDIMSGEDYTNLHNSLSNGKWYKGCETCKFSEENNIKSRRQNYIERFEEGDFLLDIALGNYCNLKCRMCNESLSTSWFSDAMKMGRAKPKLWQVTKDQIDSIIEFVSNKKSLEIELKGGEPLLNPQCQYFFEKLKTLDIPVKILVTSNGTDTPDWFLKSYEIFDIDYIISIDGMYDVYEYVRGDKTFTWDDCVKRISELEKLIDFRFNYVVQNFTVHQMKDFTEFTSKNINWIMLDNPKYLACNVIPDDAKQEIIENIEKIEKIPKNDFTKLPGFVNMIRNKCSNQTYLEFMIVSKKLDSLRGQSLEKTFPHLIQ